MTLMNKLETSVRRTTDEGLLSTFCQIICSGSTARFKSSIGPEQSCSFTLFCCWWCSR